MTEETTAEEQASPLDALIETLDQPESRILPLLLAAKENNNETTTTPSATNTKQELLQACQHLFQQIEGLAKTFQSLNDAPSAGDQGGKIPTSLSGLDQLFLHEGVDAETVWGQVDLQNEALLKRLLKKSVKRLGRSPEDICVLNMNEVLSEEEKDDADESNDDSSDEGSQSHDEGEEDEDEETKRIRERMERAMDDMDSENEEEEDDSASEEPAGKGAKSSATSSKKRDEDEESLFDPVAEDLKDGFFDLNEMEDFADEEEEFLPDEAYGQPEKEKKKNPQKKKSFHQRQRDGDLESGSDDDDDDDDDDDFEDHMNVRRKKYRDDEDIDALYNLYQQPRDDDDDGEDDPINMTAADFFGKPKKKYIDQYKKNHPKKAGGDGEDDDSWGDYDFEKEDQKVGWADGQEEEQHEQVEGASSEDENDSGGDDSDHDEEDEPQDKKDTSRFGKQNEKLKKQTEELEKELIAEKPWQMTGEAKGTARPVNSLLEGTPEFQVATKQAPVITVEHTTNLEDVIKQRIIAEDWDDVVPRELPDIGWHKKRGELPEVSQEKSKLGLGELYEREYLKKAVGYDKDAEEIKTEEDKAKDEMKQLFANLCSKLDALSNYHFAPRPVADEAEARPVTTPAIAMEEVLPLHVSDARGVAPEEVYGAKRGREGILREDTELEQSERKRLRQSKKAARRKKRKEKLADEKLISRLEPGLGLNNPYEKRKAREELAMARASGRVTTGEKELNVKYGSSGTFFKRLQEEAQQTIKGSAGEGFEQKEKRGKPKSSAFKL